MNWCIRQDSHLQTLRSKRRMIIISPRMQNGADGEIRTLVGQCARQFTKLLLSLLSHAGMKWWVATVLPRALRFKRPLHRCNACNPNATRRRSRTAAARPVKSWPAPVFASREMDEHQGSAPCIPVWKTGVYLSTPMPDEMESRAGIAPASAVLQTAA